MVPTVPRRIITSKRLRQATNRQPGLGSGSNVVAASPDVEWLAVAREWAIADYRVAVRSRHVSAAGRNEVFGGKALFGAFGDGKEVAQVALARFLQPGDWRAGYYRDQTLMFAGGLLTPRQFFAQLYGDTDITREPSSGGRQMNSHFASRLLDESGSWLNQLTAARSAADFSPVAAQMPVALGLAFASSLYRHDPLLAVVADGFSNSGREITVASIGNGGAAEGIFFETVNAAAILQVPLVVSVWDDGYGISVPNDLQMAKASVSASLAGFGTTAELKGIDIYTVAGWNYPDLIRTYAIASENARKDHRPALVHVFEMTQPFGHTTSGSHERYKDPERIRWERDWDALARMRRWIIDQRLADAGELDAISDAEALRVASDKDAAYEAAFEPIKVEALEVADAIEILVGAGGPLALQDLAADLRSHTQPTRRLVNRTMFEAVLAVAGDPSGEAGAMRQRFARYRGKGRRLYRSHLTSETSDSPLKVVEVAAQYGQEPETVDGRLILVRFFRGVLEADPRVFIIGEDVGRLGDVNLVYEGLLDEFGPLRVVDTGIREATILGQGIGAALRGLRPIVDIQYVDYFLFALEVAADQLATLRHRTAGGQKAPVIIRTKGHRLVGMTHSGSPMAMILSACQGIHVCVPRNMTQAAGMYRTLLKGDDPGIVIEVLNGYRVKEAVPTNLHELTIPLGDAEVIRVGSDVTVVTYGAMCRIALEAAEVLARVGIDTEVIDVQTLSPIDLKRKIRDSIAKTGAIIVADEDIPGGASAYILREILEVQGGYELLDAAPRTVAASPSRPAYGPDGDYFSKPSRDDVIEVVYGVMAERAPGRFPPIGLGDANP